jgi:hypothetical protein
LTFRVGDTLAQALRLYRLLFQRSIVVAALVYAVLAVVQLAGNASSGSAAGLISLVWSLLSLAGPVIVEGALVALARNVHEGEPPVGNRALAELVRLRFWRLVGGAIVYALGIVGGVLLLVIPGLVVLARWSLIAPAIVLENRSVSDARERSKALVRGRTGPVLVAIAAPLVLGLAGGLAILESGFGTGTTVFLDFLWSTVTAPFSAHVLTAVYYRLAEPDRPILHPDAR